MSRFLDDATGILETASAAAEGAPPDLAILVDRSGGVRVVESAGWRPEALQAHYGSHIVYQVSRSPGKVVVRGRHGSRACTLEMDRPSPGGLFPWARARP